MWQWLTGDSNWCPSPAEDPWLLSSAFLLPAFSSVFSAYLSFALSGPKQFLYSLTNESNTWTEEPPTPSLEGDTMTESTLGLKRSHDMHSLTVLKDSCQSHGCLHHDEVISQNGEESYGGCLKHIFLNNSYMCIYAQLNPSYIHIQS